MKKILVALLLLSFCFASCVSKGDEKRINLDEIEEVLYVIKSEIKYLSDIDEPQVSYLTYIDYKDKVRNEYKDNKIPGDIDFIQSHIFYKHKHQYVIRVYSGIPVISAEPISLFLNLEESSGVNSAYMVNILKKLNEKSIILKKDGKVENFYCDSFLFNLELVNGKVIMNYKRFLPNGEVNNPPYAEENIIMKDIETYLGHIEDCKNHIIHHENVVVSNLKFLENSRLYADYMAKKRRYEESKNNIFNVDDPKIYYEIKTVIDNNPEILANKDLYTKEALLEAKKEIKYAKSQIEMYSMLIWDENKIVDSLQSRLKKLTE